MQPELLCPAKNIESGRAAINYGADAVYIGAPKFGARAAVGNSVSEIESLAGYAHKYNARVYATVNTILYDSELEEARDLIFRLYSAGVDALIIQDTALLKMDLPPIPLFASTQMHNYNIERIKFLENAGLSRIILARELSLGQIREIRESTSAELEFFVHGALCVSLSGQCYFSRAANGRSANRGECSQPCRHLYSLLDGRGKTIIKDKYLLSLKDLILSPMLRQLLSAGISSFKIEGRLKDINYVKNITSFYRKALDQIIDSSPGLSRASSGRTEIKFEPDPERSFNRGFTSYFINGRSKGMSSCLSPKSIGKTVGRVRESSSNFIISDLSEKLANGDGLCFFNAEGALEGFYVNKIDQGKIYPNEMKIPRPGAILYRNFDKAFESMLDNDRSIRQIDVDIRFSEEEGGFRISALDEDDIKSDMFFPAVRQPADNPRFAAASINKCLSRTGNTIFKVKNIEIDVDIPSFFPVSILNEARRNLLAKLEAARLLAYQRRERQAAPGQNNYPADECNYTLNVANRLAEAFYREHGVSSIERAFELQKEYSGMVIMTSRYCIRHEFGLCEKYNKSNSGSMPCLPLFIRDKNRTYRLEFDCRNCLMKVIY